MTPTQQLSEMYAQYVKELADVREQYHSLDLATRLMRRTGADSIEDAFAAEAKQRLRRNAWAAVTREAA